MTSNLKNGKFGDMKPWNFLHETYTPFKKGLDMQREVYKRAMLYKDYETAVIALENIFAEIKLKIINKYDTKKLIRFRKIIKWYKTLPLKFTQNTEDGYQLVYPPDIEIRIQNNLNIAYEIIVFYLNMLGII